MLHQEKNSLEALNMKTKTQEGKIWPAFKPYFKVTKLFLVSKLPNLIYLVKRHSCYYLSCKNQCGKILKFDHYSLLRNDLYAIIFTINCGLTEVQRLLEDQVYTVYYWTYRKKIQNIFQMVTSRNYHLYDMVCLQ